MTKRILAVVLVLVVAGLQSITGAADQSTVSKGKQKKAKWELPGKRITANQKRALENYGDDIFVEFDKQEIPSSIVGQLSPRAHEKDPVADAEMALEAHGPAFRRGLDDHFNFESISEDRQGDSHVRMKQEYKGIPVMNGAFTVRLSKDQVTGIYGSFVADLDIATQPIVTGEQVAANALSFIKAENGRKVRVMEKRELIIFVDEANVGSLAIQVRVSYQTADADKFEVLFVDAQDGTILGRHAIDQGVGIAACCPPPNFLKNPGFELGSNGNWSESGGVIWQGGRIPPRNGSWEAWFCGYGFARRDTLSQDVYIPANVTSAILTFWINIRTDERSSYPYDTFEVVAVIGQHAERLAYYSNANQTSGYISKSINVTGFKGRVITIFFAGQEDGSLATDFVVDDTILTWTVPPITP